VKRVFISYSHRDAVMRDNLEGLFMPRLGPVRAIPARLTEDLRDKGESAIVDAIKRAMRPCCGVMLVLGQDVHSSEWIEYELQVADSWGLPRIGIRHPQSTGGPPGRFPRLKVVDWERSAIAAEVNAWKDPRARA